MGGVCSTYWRQEKIHRVLLGTHEVKVKRSLGKLRRKWKYNIKMNLQEVGLRGNDWIRLAQERNKRRALVNAVINIWVP